MKNLNHTKGPWLESIFEHEISIVSGKNILCDIWKKHNGKANSRLIKTSPEMVGALINTNKQISKLMEIHSCGDLEKLLIPIFMDNCSVIEKATGYKWEEIIE